MCLMLNQLHVDVHVIIQNHLPEDATLEQFSGINILHGYSTNIHFPEEKTLKFPLTIFYNHNIGCRLFTSKYTEHRSSKELPLLSPALSFISSKRSSSSHIFSFAVNVRITPYISSDVSDSESIAS